MKHLRYFAMLMLVVFLSSTINATPLMAQRLDDSEPEQFAWDFEVRVVDIRGVEHELPGGIVSAQQAIDTGMAALLRYFPQFEQDFFANKWNIIYFRDPAKWQAEADLPERRIGSAGGY